MDWSQIIAAGVGPIIVISACGLLCLALYNRLSAVATRLRSFHRERLHEDEDLVRLRAAPQPDRAAIVRHEQLLRNLEVQTGRVLRRARLVRGTLYCFLLTIGALALCSLCVGLATVWPALMYAAVPLFVVGLLLLVTGVGFALAELSQTLHPIELESRFVSEVVELEPSSPQAPEGWEREVAPRSAAR